MLNPDNYAKMKTFESSPECPLYSKDLNDFADNVHVVEYHDFVHD